MDSSFILYIVFMCILVVCYCIFGCVALFCEHPSQSPSDQEIRQMVRKYVDEALTKREAPNRPMLSIPASMIDATKETPDA